MAEEKQPLTLEDIKKDNDLMLTIDRYSRDRYNRGYADADKAVEDFLSEYRGIQNNTVSALTFANYASEIDDPEYKEKLGRLYSTFDNELENFADVEGVGSGLMAAGEILAYNIFDPINLLGFGAGKLVASTAGRAGLKKVIGQSLASKAAKRPITTGVATGVVTEGALGVAAEGSVQRAEQDLDVREGYDLTGLAIAGGLSGVVGGVAGGLGGRAAAKTAEQMDQLFKQTEAASVQGQVAVMDNLEQAVLAPPTVAGQAAPIDVKKDLAEVFVTSESIPDNVKSDYDSLGRVVSIDETKKTAQVQYLPKGADKDFEGVGGFDKGAVMLEIPLADLKAPSARETNRMLNKYVESYGDFLDPKQVAEGRKFLNIAEPGVDPDKLVKSIPIETLAQINETIIDFLSSPEIITNPYVPPGVFDPRLKITERFAQIIDVIPEENFDNVRKVLDAGGISMDTLAQIYRADISQAGRMLQLQSAEKTQQLLELANKIGGVDNKKMAVVNQYIKELNQTIKEEETTPWFSKTIDIWRAFLVSQPSTTALNVLGSAARLPEEFFRATIDNMLINMQRSALGLDPLDQTEILKRNPFDVLNNFSDAGESIALTQHVALFFNEVDTKIIKVFDDLIPAQYKGKGPLNKLGKASVTINALNVYQDRWFKSASFLTELNAQYIEKVNLGMIEAPSITLSNGTTKKLSNLRDLIQYNRLDLMNDEMVSKSIQFAFDMAYQNRKIGEKMPFGGKFVQDTLDGFIGFAKKVPLLKVAVPFPTFQANSFVYTLNRILPFGAVKSGWNFAKLMRMNGVPAAKRKAYQEAQERLIDAQQKLMASTDKAEKANLRGVVKDLSTQVDALGELSLEAQRESLQYFTKFKEGFVESAGAVSLYASTYVLYTYAGGDTWNKIKSGDQELDIKRVFPLSGYMLAQDAISRFKNALPFPETYADDAAEVLAGLAGSRGSVAPELTELMKALTSPDNTEDVNKKLGEFVGKMVGSFTNGFLIPTRPAYEAMTSQGALERDYRDRRLQKDVIPEEFLPDDPEIRTAIQGFMDGLVKETVKGTPFENQIFSKTPRAASFTGEQPRSGRGAVFRQFFGVTPSMDNDLIMNEIEKTGIDPYSLRRYSSVPEYDNKRDRILGEVSKAVLIPILKSRAYRTASLADKRRIIQLAYNNSVSSDAPEQIKRFRKAAGFSNVNDLRDIANISMEEEYPVVTAVSKIRNRLNNIGGDAEARVLGTIREGGPGVVSLARSSLEKQGVDTTPLSDQGVLDLLVPRLSYKEEKDPANEEHNKRLLATIDLYDQLAPLEDAPIREITEPSMIRGGTKFREESRRQ
jgi:hypothetical protein